MIEILVEKVKPVASCEHDFEYLKQSTPIALSGILASSGIQCNSKNLS